MYYWGRLYQDVNPQEAPRLYRRQPAPCAVTSDHVRLERHGARGWTGVLVYQPRFVGKVAAGELRPLDEAAALVHILMEG